MRITLEEYWATRHDADTAFIGVDLQNDFGHKKGSLYVAGGEELVEVANDVVPEFSQGLVFWTKDCHPADHCSFVGNGGPWPAHCTKGKWGYQFMRGLDVGDDDIIIMKGVDQAVDSYSAFFDNERRNETELREILEGEEVGQIFVMGLATDYCVKFTVLDALDLGFSAVVYLPGCRGVEISEGDIETAIKEMEEAGAVIIEG